MSNRFDLEQRIVGWRRQLVRSGLNSVETLDELESHLREEIDQLTQSGKPAEEAFELAVANLGNVCLLQTEFAKLKTTNNWSRFVRASIPFAGAFMTASTFWTFLECDLSLAQRTVGFAVGLTTGAYVVYLPRLLKSLDAAGYIRFSKVIKLAGVLVWLWPAFALAEALHYTTFQLPILPMMSLWCVYAAIVMTIASFALIGRDSPRHGFGGPSLRACRNTPKTPARPGGAGVSQSTTTRLNPAARAALATAFREAERLGHDFVGTEHILLGILKSARSVFKGFFQKLNLDPSFVINEVERSVLPVSPGASRAQAMFTPRATRALELAAREAILPWQPWIGPEHILLGLLRERTGVAGRVLRRLGLRLRTARVFWV